MNQSIRIIGGKFRGKKISFPLIEGLRPTPDRIRETLFNWLMHDIREANCLDAFAGSGALGVEAFSRGAKNVTFVEYSPIAYDALRQVISTFSDQRLRIIKADVRDFLQKTPEVFDIIFLDPPFSSDYLNECIGYLTVSSCLRQGGLIYIESDKKISLDSIYWQEKKSKKAGHVFYSLFEKL